MSYPFHQLSLEQSLTLLDEGDISSYDLTQSCLSQIKKFNPEVNAFITIEKNALREAREADDNRVGGENLPLSGIPIALKDIFLTQGMRTTAASKVLENYIPQYDATVVERLIDAGAIIIGKTNCDAWAHGSSGENSDFGPTKNPWNTEYVPGGSSSGSAAAVSSNMCIAATGTDTGGSIRLPASFCGVVGLKPTYGLVSRYGIIAMASSLDSIGHFTKTVKDSALILNVTAGPDAQDATLRQTKPENYTDLIDKDIKGMRLGVPKEFVEGLEGEVKTIFDNSLRSFEKLGAEIVDVSLPMTEYGIATYYILQPSEVSSNLARYDGIRYGLDRSHFGDEAKRRIMLGTFTLSSGYYDAYYKKAMQVRTLIIQDFNKAFERVDALVAPVSPTPPWKLGEKVDDPLAMYLSDALTVTVNIAGTPSLAVPAGFASDKLPIGIQIMGPHFAESKLFQIGHAFESETKFYKEKPAL